MLKIEFVSKIWLIVDLLPLLMERACGAGAQVKAHAKTAQPRVKQAKILTEDAPAGGRAAPKSRGRGFVEFGEHDHAMAALRHLNNNPAPFGDTPLPFHASTSPAFRPDSEGRA